jgi:hypothetical protein
MAPAFFLRPDSAVPPQFAMAAAHFGIIVAAMSKGARRMARILPHSCRRVIRFLAILGAGLIAASMLPMAGAWLLYRYAPVAAPATDAPNAVWAGHHWVGQAHGEEAYDDLATHLRRHRISDVYFHVGPLSADGLIPPGKYSYAGRLLEAMRERAPEIMLHAWIGQVEKRGGGPLDISDGTTRANIVATAGAFAELGFDGIHYNIEPIRSGDPHLLALLEDSASVTRDRGRFLSMATDELTPLPGLEYLAHLFVRQAGLWRADYYREVAARTDQVAVMMYDTAIPLDWMYGAVVAWETWRLREIVGPETTLFMGVPTYEDEHFGFHPEAENMHSGLRGIGIGLALDSSSAGESVGAAVYANWTTDEAEWEIWRRHWLGNRN